MQAGMLAAILSVQQAVAVYEAGRLGEAQAALEQIVREEPRNPDALAWLAAAELENTGDARAAEEILTIALRLDPQSARAHMLLGVALARRIGSSSIFEKISLAGRLKREMVRAVELAPDSADARAALMQFYLHAPTIAGGGAGKAREQAREIARAHPFEGLIAQGLVEAYLGKDADPLFRRALETAGDARQRARALADLGKLRVAQKRAAESLTFFREAAAMRPDDPLALVDLGDGQLAAGDARAAADSYRSASDLDPRLVSPWLGLGRALAGMGRAAEARAAYGQFLELAPRHERSGEARAQMEALR